MKSEARASTSAASKMPRTLFACAAAVLALLLMFVPSGAYAAGAAPDGSHRLIEIFPDSDSPALAVDIAAQIGAPDTDFMPASQAAFDNVTTVSLPTSDVKYIDGIQYCRNLKYLYLPGNMLADEALGTLVGMAYVSHLDLSDNRLTSAAFAHISGLPLETFLVNGCGIGADGWESLPASITVFELSDNDIGDKGAEAISARFPALVELDVSGNGITDKGAQKLAQMQNRANMAIDITDNHIGSVGMKALIAAGFKSLKMDGQTLTADTVTDGRIAITHKALVDAVDMAGAKISDNGSYDSHTNAITWPAANKDKTYSYTYGVGGYSGTVYVPFKYRAFVYQITFVDGLGHNTVVEAKDEDCAAPPADPKRDGYIFTGWSLVAGDDELFDFGTPITGNLTLYAGWTQNVEDSNEKSSRGSGSGPTSTGGRGDGESGVSKNTGQSNPDTSDSTFPEAAPWGCLISAMTLVFLVRIYYVSRLCRRRARSKRAA